jgi:hypothetical protein
MWYRSVREGCLENEVLRQAILAHDVEPQHLLKRMRQVRPDLERRKLTIRKPLINTRHNAGEERLRDAAFLLVQPMSYFKRIVWLDAASFHVMPDGKVEVWASADRHDLQRTDVHLGIAPNKRVSIKYYAAVNWLKGPVAIVFVTGTTGVDKIYKVSCTHRSCITP